MSCKTVFPKYVRIIFIEDRDKRKKVKPSLNFDQDACIYFVTQMNAIQPLFIFEIVNKKLTSGTGGYELPKDGNIMEWFKKFVNDSWADHSGVECWIGISSTPIEGISEKVAGGLISLITTKDWERYFSPPNPSRLLECFRSSILPFRLWFVKFGISDATLDAFSRVTLTHRYDMLRPLSPFITMVVN